MARTSTAPLLGGRETPVSAPKKPLPPFPKRQMFVLALCRLCEPIAFMGIFPYIYFMIQDFHITEDEKQISFYAGLVTSAFTFAEFLTGVFWGRLSDRIGRKPVLMTGLAGTALSVIMFGFAPNLTVALIARALGGILNGNIGVMQTTVGELVKVKEHHGRAFSVIPAVWCIGSMIGPAIGGALARPCVFYPSIFRPGSIWDTYPYLLPNLFSACAVFIGLFAGIFFLEETHPVKKHEIDRGIILGQKIAARLSWRKESTKGKKLRMLAEEEPLIDADDQLPGYQTTEASPSLVSRDSDVNLRDVGSLDPFDLDATTKPTKPAETLSTSSIFTRPIILNTMSFGILAFHTMTFDQLLPVFLSTAPPTGSDIDLPFKFSGGFGFDNQTVGIVMAVQGFYSLLSNTFLFPWVIGRIGPLRLFQLVAIPYFTLYLVTPYLVLLPDSIRMATVYLVIIWKCTFSTLAYPSNALITMHLAPNPLQLGTVNGVSASAASLCRAFGPTISGFLYAVGQESGFSSLPWWCASSVAIMGAFVAMQLTMPAEKLLEEKTDDVETALPLLQPVAGPAGVTALLHEED
ncbi:MFS multidrug transporter [Sporothrix schenckii 1099-18]|uniref:MFS multidrug transporter n=1 Tax=Sporothrix schenckii 1099-18 TaxID=1397361 RepID=A0A0F2M274_SPOSC|nr:MFS multidrug transporter [Sporothrix schenckii 1099-18]KJR82236.1 MFS multidrug transporter [Sporothrix schenckii 1099-18]